MDKYEEIELAIAVAHGKTTTTRKAVGDFMLADDHAVNIKSNNVDKQNYSPNMISIKKMHQWPEPLKNTGSTAENYAFEKVVVTRTTGIVRILSRTLKTFDACAYQQKRLHQLFETLYVVAVRWKSVSAALLIILWSSVQVTHALPFLHPKPLCTTLQSGFCLNS